LSGQSALTLKPMDNYLHFTSSIPYLFLGYAFVLNQNFSGFLELGYWLWTFTYFHESAKYDHPGKCGTEGLFMVTLTDVSTIWGQIIINVKWSSGSLYSDDDFCSGTGCPNAIQCHHKQSFSGLRLPGRSQFTDLWYDSWVQIICYILRTLIARENWGYESAL